MANFPSIQAIFQQAVTGLRLLSGDDLLFLIKALGLVPVTGLNAASASVTSAVAVNLGASSIDVSVTNGAVLLPAAIPGAFCEINNNTGNSIQIFGQQANQSGFVPATGDQIIPTNTTTPVAVATGVAQASGKLSTYTCFVGGTWKQLLSS